MTPHCVWLHFDPHLLYNNGDLVVLKERSCWLGSHCGGIWPCWRAWGQDSLQWWHLTWRLGSSSVKFSCSVVSDSLWPHGLQRARLPCLSSTPRACSSSCPLSWWCHPTILSSVIAFSSCLQSFPAMVSFPMSQYFTSGGQSIGVSASASVLPMNIHDWSL